MRWALPLALGLGLPAPAGAQHPPTCDGGTTALVLSGGGAKGLAHIAVLRVLDSLGARPDLVVGTSMGAMIGALYASGYSGREIDSLARATPPAALFAPGEAHVPRPWRPQVPLLVWEAGAEGFALRSPGISEGEINAMLAAMYLRGNLLARGDFDALPIPFRAVATNLANRDTVVLRDGDLAQAVRASIAVPLVFPPERVDGRVLTDGGISANIPIEIARRHGATRVIVSDVSGRLVRPEELNNPIAVADQLAGFLFLQPPDAIGPEDIRIKIDLDDYRSLDFRRVALDSIRVRGRAAADSILPRAACLPRSTRPAADPPRPMIGSFTADGVDEASARVLMHLLGLVPGETLDEPLLRAQLARLAELDAYKSAWLHPEGPADTVHFRVRVRPGPRRIAGATAAYDNDLGARLGVAFLDHSLLRLGLEASAAGGFSRRRTDLAVGLRRYFGVGRSRLAPAVVLRLAEEAIPIHNASGNEIGRPTTQEASLFVGLERDLASDWVVELGFDTRVWRDADTTLQTDRGPTGSSGGLLFRAMHFPGSSAFVAEGIWSGTYRSVRGEFAVDLRSGKLKLTPRLRAGWGEYLPLQARFPLGGTEGFPGLSVEELRGDRELFGSLQGTWPIRGPFTARLLLAAGRSANSGSLLDDAHWLGGVRAGVGADTPLGPVRFEYGVATNRRDNLFVRIGRWF